MLVWVVLRDIKEVDPTLLAVFHPQDIKDFDESLAICFLKEYIQGFCSFAKIWHVFFKVSYHP